MCIKLFGLSMTVAVADDHTFPQQVNLLITKWTGHVIPYIKIHITFQRYFNTLKICRVHYLKKHYRNNTSIRGMF